jgi:hypothetical protein
MLASRRAHESKATNSSLPVIFSHKPQRLREGAISQKLLEEITQLRNTIMNQGDMDVDGSSARVRHFLCSLKVEVMKSAKCYQ